MPSQQPQQSQASRTPARRRQRSTRLVVAVALLGVSAAIVLGAVASSSAGLTAVAAVLAVVLGAAATRITHSEVMQARRDAFVVGEDEVLDLVRSVMFADAD